MTTYRTVKGYNIKKVSSDPANVKEGQIWYNSSTSQIKIAPKIGAWASGANFPATKRLLAGFGTQTAAIAAGGSPNNALTFHYNGSAWTAGGDLNTSKNSLDGVGTQTAGLVFGGNSPGGRLNESEEYDGSSWTEGNNMNSSRSDSHGAGLQTASVAAFGIIGTSRTNKTEEYDGTSWSEVTNAPTSNDGTRGSGTLTAGIFTGGDTPTKITTTYLYDGTNWTTGNAMPQALSKHAASGTQTAALVFGGASPAADAEVDTAAYDGTSWTQIADMATGRQELNGADASSTATLAICGELQPGNSNAVEEFTSAATTRTVDVS